MILLYGLFGLFNLLLLMARTLFLEAENLMVILTPPFSTHVLSMTSSCSWM